MTPDDLTCTQCREHLPWYVTGTSSEGEWSAVERHLAGCADCRDELAGLAGLPALLSRVPADEAARLLVGSDPAPAEPVLAAVLDRAVRLRKQRAWPRIAAAVAAGVIVGAGAASASRVLGQSPGPGAAGVARQWTRTVRGSDPRTHASAVIRYQSRPWGLELAVQVRGIATGTRCWLDVTSTRGQQVASGSWTVADGDKAAWYPASAAITLPAARNFVIIAGARTQVTVAVPR